MAGIWTVLALIWAACTPDEDKSYSCAADVDQLWLLSYHTKLRQAAGGQGGSHVIWFKNWKTCNW